MPKTRQDLIQHWAKDHLIRATAVVVSEMVPPVVDTYMFGYALFI